MASLETIWLSILRKLQALIDWECVSIMPLWKACQIPSFIDILKRTERPNSEDYKRNANESIDSLLNMGILLNMIVNVYGITF